MFCSRISLSGQPFIKFSLTNKVLTKKSFKKGAGRDWKGTEVPAGFAKKLNEWPKLLQLEIKSQKEQIKGIFESSNRDWTDLEKRGLALADLDFVEEHFDPVEGRILTFRKYGSGKHFRKGLKSGIPVTLYEASNLRKIADCYYKDSAIPSTVTLITNFNQKFTGKEEGEYVIIPSPDVHTLQTLQEDLTAKNLQRAPGKRLVDFAFHGAVMPSIHNDRPREKISNELNDNQKRAVAAALNNQRPFVCIQGPPGTGKTHVAAEIIRLISQRGQKVLVCAPSHVAVNNLMEKTVDILKNDDPDTLEDIDGDQDDLIEAKRLDDAITEHPDYVDLAEISSELSITHDQTEKRAIIKKFNLLKRKIIKDCYKNKKVIFCTLTSSVVRRLKYVDWHPDVIVIDEAAMCIEPQSWAAIIKAKRCILVGDHAQLPPVIHSTEALQKGLGVSLMERLCKDFSGSNLTFLLSTQFRMNKTIMEWSSRNFYDSQLIAHEKVADQVLSDICNIPEEHKMHFPMIFFNTGDGESFHDEIYKSSYRNISEAERVADYSRFLINSGVPMQSIGIITPYFAQVETIKGIVPEQISVNSVDAFQGQEREIIIFSLVRNNLDNIIGFLREARRMNVAVTRAKRQFCLIGCGKTLQKSKELRSLFEYMKTDGKIYSIDDVPIVDSTSKSVHSNGYRA